MNETNKSFKKAHALLGIPAIITCLIILLKLIYSGYIFSIACQDTNGGGWIMFYQMIFGIISFPFFGLAIAHCITCLVSFLKRENNKKVSRGLGIASSILGIITMIIFLPCTFIFGAVIGGIVGEVFWLATFLEFLNIISLVIALVFFAKTKIQL